MRQLYVTFGQKKEDNYTCLLYAFIVLIELLTVPLFDMQQLCSKAAENTCIVFRPETLKQPLGSMFSVVLNQIFFFVVN